MVTLSQLVCVCVRGVCVVLHVCRRIGGGLPFRVPFTCLVLRVEVSNFTYFFTRDTTTRDATTWDRHNGVGHDTSTHSRTAVCTSRRRRVVFPPR